MNSQLGEFFKTKVGVRQGCLLSSILFDLFLEKIMQETLHDHYTSLSIGGRPICSLRFSDDIDVLGGTNRLVNLTNRLVDRAMACAMEVSTENSQINIGADLSMNGQKLEDVINFKYLGATCARMVHAQRKSISGLPQQWPD